MNYKQPTYGVRTVAPTASFPGTRLELTHAAGPGQPSSFCPSWVTYISDEQRKGASAHADVLPDGSLSLDVSEWYENARQRTVERRVMLTLDPKAAAALMRYLNDRMPSINPLKAKV